METRGVILGPHGAQVTVPHRSNVFSPEGTFSLAQTRKCSTKLRVRHLMSAVGFMNSLGVLLELGLVFVFI